MVSFKPTIITAFAAFLVFGNISPVFSTEEQNQSSGGGSGGSGTPQEPNSGAGGNPSNPSSTDEDKKKAVALDVDLLKETKKVCTTVRAKLATKANTKFDKLGTIEGEPHKEYVTEKKKELDESRKKFENNLTRIEKTKKIKIPADTGTEVDAVDDSVAGALSDVSSDISDIKTLSDDVSKKVSENLKGDEVSATEHADIKEKATLLQESCNGIGTILDKLTAYLNNDTTQNIKKEFDERKKNLTSLKTKVDNKDEDYNAHFRDMTAEAQNAVGEVKKAIDAVVAHRKANNLDVDDALFSNLSTLLYTIIETSRAYLPGVAFALLSSVAMFLF